VSSSKSDVPVYINVDDKVAEDRALDLNTWDTEEIWKMRSNNAASGMAQSGKTWEDVQPRGLPL
jgi:hypothetical protein